MTTKDKKKAILRAIEAIQSGEFRFCCTALSHESPHLRNEFSDLFRPSCSIPYKTWYFTTVAESRRPPTEEQIAIRLTALWFFYHMQ